MESVLFWIVVGASIAYLAAPVFVRRRAKVRASRNPHLRRSLQDRFDALLFEIRDLELESVAGKVSDEDFIAMDKRYRDDAADILRRLDAIDETRTVSNKAGDARRQKR